MRILFLRCIYIAVVICLAMGCAEKEKAEQNNHIKQKDAQLSVRKGGVYRFPLGNNPSTLDPAYAQDAYATPAVHQLFDRLVQFGPYLRVLPALAESWRMEEEGRAYRFFLRSDVSFHNGRQMTIEDVVFSVQRLVRAEPPTAILPHLLKIQGAQAYHDRKKEKIEGMQKIDEHTLLVRLTEPHIPFLTALGAYQASIVPKATVLTNPDNFGRHPIGTGPYKFVSWLANQSLKLEKFPAYYAGKAYLDGIEYRIYPGIRSDQMLTDFQDKNLEEIPVFSDIREQLADPDQYQWFRRPALNLFFYGMNCEHPNLSNIELRKALFASIDRQQLIHEVYKDRYEMAKTLLPPGMPGYKPGEFSEIKSSLATPVLKNLPPIEIVSASTSPYAMTELEFIRRSWQKIGISMKTKFIPNWAEFEKYVQSDSVQIYRYDWTADMPDPDSILYSLFASDSPVNYMRYKNDAVDKMLLKARGIIDPVERATVYQRIEKKIIQEMPLIPILHFSVDRVYQPYVKGITISALGVTRTLMHRVWLTEPDKQ